MRKRWRVVTQSLLIVVAVAALSLLAVSLWSVEPEQNEFSGLSIPSATATAVEIAQHNHLPLQVVASGLDVNPDRADDVSLTDLGLTPQEAELRITKKLLIYNERRSKNWVKIALKFALWFLVLPVPVILLRSRRLTPKRRKLLLAVAIVVFGIALGADPSPMGTVKDAVYLFSAHGTIFWPRIVALGLFLLTVVPANKLICSWGCQFGVLQEFLFRLNRNRYDRKGIMKQYKPPFWLSNSIRIAVFLSAILIASLWTFDLIGAIDPFKVYAPAQLTIASGILLLIVTASSLFIYRPWCHFACPFGLVSWLLERVSWQRIIVDDSLCDRCNVCTYACPSHAMTGILNAHTLPADCFSCGTCIETCPTSAIAYTVDRKSNTSNEARTMAPVALLAAAKRQAVPGAVDKTPAEPGQ